METANEHRAFSPQEDEDDFLQEPTDDDSNIIPKLNTPAISARKTKKKKSKNKVIFNISDTHYPVVKQVGKMLKFKASLDPSIEWDVFWTDGAVKPDTLAKMQPFQKINHFPGMYCLARKNHLAKNLMRMKKAFPDSYKFFPQTFLLPSDYNEFRSQFADKTKPMTYIVKPEASCQGRGIFLTRKWENVKPDERYVVQRYLHKPFLLDGLKFDLRIYVLVAGCDPLRIYLFNDGLARFATEEYIAPSSHNMEKMCMHLTNYAINKDNPNFVFNEDEVHDDVGHKRSIKSLFKTLDEKGYDTKSLWNDIKKIVIKTLCSVQPILAHNYRSCQGDEPYNNMCFEILGFDILLDHKLKPWLLEVNHTPSFTTDTPLDQTIKQNVIKDALQLMNISVNHRIRYKNKKKIETQERVLTGKIQKNTKEEKIAIVKKAQQERDEWESKHLGGYEKLFPLNDGIQTEENYTEFLKTARQFWEGWTSVSTILKQNVKKSAGDEQSSIIPEEKQLVASKVAKTKKIQIIYSQPTKLNAPGAPSKKESNTLKPRQKENTPSIPRKTTFNNTFSESFKNQRVSCNTNYENPVAKRVDTYDGNTKILAENDFIDNIPSIQNFDHFHVNTLLQRDLNTPHLDSIVHASQDISSDTTSLSGSTERQKSPTKTTLKVESDILPKIQPQNQNSRNPSFRIHRQLRGRASLDLPARSSSVNKENSLANNKTGTLERGHRQSSMIQAEPSASNNLSDHAGWNHSIVNEMLFRPSVNSMTGILDEVRGSQEQIGSRQGSNYHKKTKSLNCVDYGSPFYVNNEVFLNRDPNKMENTLIPNHRKTSVGNYLPPKNFEMKLKPNTKHRKHNSIHSTIILFNHTFNKDSKQNNLTGKHTPVTNTAARPPTLLQEHSPLIPSNKRVKPAKH